MKSMVVGISPTYNYPGDYTEWNSRNTFYASNFGASLITRSLMKIFDADYVSDFSNIGELNKKYDLCILAFATHITTWRSVDIYADLAEKLKMKILIPSLGVQDYSQNSEEVFTIHGSLRRLLDIVSERTPWIGVRGPLSASFLYQNGYKNVLPIGCPTLKSLLNDKLTIQKKEKFDNPIIVYQQNFSQEGSTLLKKAPILAQDFLDEAIFTNHLDEDKHLQKKQRDVYQNFKNKDVVLEAIKVNGIFPKSFEDWYQIIGQKDFVIGTRLHGVIAGLLQGVPSVLVPRDMRTFEMASFYNFPTTDITKLGKNTLEKIYDNISLEQFLNTYKKRYRNFYTFLEENGVEHNLTKPSLREGYDFDRYDFVNAMTLLFPEMEAERVLEKKTTKDYITAKLKRNIKRLINR